MISGILNTDPEKRFTLNEIRGHSWFRKIVSEYSKGIQVGYNQMPINKEILVKLEDYKMDAEYTQKCIEANKHNDYTTTYYLLLKKYKASVGVVLPLEKNNTHKNFTKIGNNVPMLWLNNSLNTSHRRSTDSKNEKKQILFDCYKAPVSYRKISTPRSTKLATLVPPRKVLINHRKNYQKDSENAKNNSNRYKSSRIKLSVLRPKKTRNKNVNNSVDFSVKNS